MDKICNELFLNSRECYVEEEYDEDGVLIYKPPPLNEFWLSEPEHCDHHAELEKQQDRATHCMKELQTCEAKRHFEKPCEWEERLPALEESDVDTDDDNSLPDCTDNELEGEGCDQEDHFVDHPTPTQLEFDEGFDKDEAPKDVVLPQEEALP